MIFNAWLDRKRGAPWRAALLLLLLLPWSAPTAPAQEGGGRATLNFNDVDIQAVIHYVAEETGVNFIVDPRVRGKVTLVSGRPVGQDELYDIFLSVLRVHGFAAVETDGVVKLIPDALAKQAEVSIPGPGEGVRSGAFVTRVVAVEHVDAAQLVPILRPLVPQSGHLAAASESNALVIADTAANVERLVQIVRRVDRPMTPGMEVIPLEHAAASEVAAIVGDLEAAEGSGRAAARLRAMADSRTNSVLLSGPQEQRMAARALISHLDVPVDGGHIQVIYLRYAEAGDVAEVLEGLSGAFEDQEGGSEAPEIHVQAHESTNALVVSAPPELMGELRSVVRRLDVRRAQVLVEAVIAEVSDERARELGVQWGVGSERDGVGIIDFGRATPGLSELGMAAETGDWSGVELGDGLTLGGIGRSGRVHIAALIRALSGDSASNILSTPSLLTMDNEEAEIVVGQNVPFRTGRAIEESGQAFDTIQRQDVGVKLTVRPQINEGNAVKLEIEQEVSQLAAGASGSGQDAADLITNKRSLRTTVLVDDGQMVVLGGLIDDVLIQTRDQVPGLGSIPGLGRLFRYDTVRKEKRNLMVFLKPVIVRDRATQTALTAGKYDYIRARQMASRGRGALMLPEDAVPVLPQWEALLHLPPPFEADPSAGEGGLRVLPPPVTP
ncbi:general secretion pathway protein D [Ectothiorhodospira mobilis]|uniref:General secretion pathway protein D n=1 Tax=Ectothiorhodospira mobilis TaxID=195064 RepID=A0A1I4R4E8_ECTMO|nr:type II secretion system protein D [Ectothiorhodospira mobilis]SFM47162.1 general secretion pathway protein D [Ectothiorhodospira mobilis]